MRSAGPVLGDAEAGVDASRPARKLERRLLDDVPHVFTRPLHGFIDLSVPPYDVAGTPRNDVRASARELGAALMMPGQGSGVGSGQQTSGITCHRGARWHVLHDYGARADAT